MSSAAKDKILHKIKQALSTSVPVPFPEVEAEPASLFHGAKDDLAILFAEQFTQLQGQFSYCMSAAEITAQLRQLGSTKGITKWYCNNAEIRKMLETFGWSAGWHPTLPDCHASITTCECLVARTGSMILSSTASGGRTPSVYAPVHICIATSEQLVYDISDGLKLMTSKFGNKLPSLISLASGPSRTADIEKTLVTGVHGPKEVFCFLIDS